MMSSSESSEAFGGELETAREAAQAAARYLLEHRGTARVVRQKTPRDQLLDTDLAAEAIILDRLHEAFPNDSLLSEEAGVSGGGDMRRQWVVDPLDGSINYLRGSPLFGVAVALLIDGVATVSVINLPALGEVYCAVRGAGATCNGAPLSPTQPTSLAQAIIQVGNFARTGNPTDNVHRIATVVELADKAGRVRMVGSAAVDFACIASGQADGGVLFGRHPWDLEAGRLIALETGHLCAVREMENRFSFICSTPGIHEELLGAIRLS